MSTLLERFEKQVENPHRLFYTDSGVATWMLPEAELAMEAFIKAESGMHREQARVADVAFQRVDQEKKILRKALRAILDRYVDLAGSGDCGHWDPETESPVIAACAALDQTTA